jgi:hypothetical protein
MAQKWVGVPLAIPQPLKEHGDQPEKDHLDKVSFEMTTATEALMSHSISHTYIPVIALHLNFGFCVSILRRSGSGELVHVCVLFTLKRWPALFQGVANNTSCKTRALSDLHGGETVFLTRVQVGSEFFHLSFVQAQDRRPRTIQRTRTTQYAEIVAPNYSSFLDSVLASCASLPGYDITCCLPRTTDLIGWPLESCLDSRQSCDNHVDRR